jgi:hypothetical protein
VDTKTLFMDNSRKNNRPQPGERDLTANRLEGRSSIPNDLPESERDKDELASEETFIDLPDVKDIPGQEFVNAPPAGILGDTTISSDDEEGTDIFDRDDSEDISTGTEADVTSGERKALQDVEYLPTTDENNLRDARLDNTDFQGEPLGEKSFGEELSGRGSDVTDNSERRGS